MLKLRCRVFDVQEEAAEAVKENVRFGRVDLGSSRLNRDDLWRKEQEKELEIYFCFDDLTMHYEMADEEDLTASTLEATVL